ncbi:MAG TPA: response regulator, partial [Vicinamibacteria bacterium]
MRGSILLVDDEERILKTLSRALKDEGHDVFVTSSATRARELLSERSFDVLIVDNRMPQVSGLELIRDLARSAPETDRPEVLMMTAHATVESAIEAMKLGAFDYLQKPFDVEELLVVVGKALSHRRLRSEHRYLLSERKT